MTKVLLVNPASVNLPALKALAANHNVDVVASPYVPTGSAYVTDLDSLFDGEG